MNSNELAEFHAFIGSQLQPGNPGITPEEALDMWRDSHPETWDDATDAVRESLADYEAGDRGLSIDEAERQFRLQFPKPAQP